MLFPSVYEKFKDKIAIDGLVSITGKIFLRAGDTPVVVVENLKEWADETEETTEMQEISQELIKENATVQTLYLKYATDDEELKETINDILNDYIGDTRVVVRCTSTGKALKMGVKVKPCAHLMNELLGILDEDCVILK